MIFNLLNYLLKQSLGLKSDEDFLIGFKSEWNIFCNLYKPRKRQITKQELKEESFIPHQITLGEKYGRLYEIYLKHKFLPDNKFSNTLDKSFIKTLQDMHDLLGINPVPNDKQNNIDLAYDVRYRGIMLIEYLIRLSNDSIRYIILSIVKLSIYLAFPIALIVGIITIYNQLFK